MKITATLNGVKVEREIPLSWSEVNFNQFVRLSKCGNDFAEILSVFTDIEPDTLRKAKISNLELVRNALQFIENEKIDETLPDSILSYRMPKNLELETIGQFEDLKLEVAELKDKGIEKYAMFCAIYACNPYDYQKAIELSKEFLNAPCSEVVAVGNFTLLKLIESSPHGQKSIQKANSRMRKLKLAMKGYLKRLAFTVRYYLWKRRLRSIVMS